MASVPALAVTAETASSPSVAVWVALITAVGPVMVIIAHEVIRRLRRSDGGPPNGGAAEGPLAPVAEVPRREYDELLSRLVQVDEVNALRERQLAEERAARVEERRRLEEENERDRERCDTELVRLRERLEDEMGRRIRAETILASLQMGGGQQ